MCVHIYIYICICIHTSRKFALRHGLAGMCFIHVHVYTYMCMYIHIYIYIYMCIYICTHIYIHTICLYLCLYVYTHIHEGSWDSRLKQWLKPPLRSTLASNPNVYLTKNTTRSLYEPILSVSVIVCLSGFCKKKRQLPFTTAPC